MTVNEQKIVEFDAYCDKCIHNKKTEEEDPCSICLANTTNHNSKKPVKYEELLTAKKSKKIEEVQNGQKTSGGIYRES